MLARAQIPFEIKQRLMRFLFDFKAANDRIKYIIIRLLGFLFWRKTDVYKKIIFWDYAHTSEFKFGLM